MGSRDSERTQNGERAQMRDENLTGVVARSLPEHPRLFSMVWSPVLALTWVQAAQGWPELRAGVEAAREALRERLAQKYERPIDECGNLMCTLVMAAKTAEVLQLIVAGAPLDCFGLGNYTPLMRACRNGHTEIVVALIGAGAQLNLQDKIGRTALKLAASYKHDDVIAILKCSGAM